MVTDNTEDMEDVKVEQLDKELYPSPPQEDPKVTKRMERQREPTTSEAMKNFFGFRKKFNLKGY